MSVLGDHLDDYLRLRRTLGFQLGRHGESLPGFVAYLEANGAAAITVELAVAWARLPQGIKPITVDFRLSAVRGFARYLHALDPVHQIPPTGLLHRGGRPEPFLFTDVDIEALMTAATSMRSPLRALTMQTLIGLLAVSGLRVGEVIRVDRDDIDVDGGLIVVRNTKLGRSRHVPLHASTIEALRAYLHRRDELWPCPASPALFISTTGTRLRSGNLRAAFAELVALVGLPPRQGGHGP